MPKMPRLQAISRPIQIQVMPLTNSGPSDARFCFRRSLWHHGFSELLSQGDLYYGDMHAHIRCGPDRCLRSASL